MMFHKDSSPGTKSKKICRINPLKNKLSVKTEKRISALPDTFEQRLYALFHRLKTSFPPSNVST